MTVLLTLLNIVVISFLILKFRKFQPLGIHPYFAISYFILKCLCGYVVMLVFRDYYKQGDIFGYFNEADFLYKLFITNPSQFIGAVFGGDHEGVLKNLELWNNTTYNPFYNDNHTMILINLIFRFISFGNIMVHIIWINFFAYLGLMWLFNCFIADNNKDGLVSISTFKINSSGIRSGKLLMLVPFFLPNVLVWGSGLLKEPLVLFALGGFFRSAQLVIRQVSFKTFFWFIFALIFFLLIKPYLLLILIPAVICLLLYKRVSSIKPAYLFISIYIGGLILILFLGNFIPALNLPAFLFGQQLSFIRNAIFSGASSFVFPVLLAPSALSFLKHIPEAIYFSFFRPWPWEFKLWWTYPISFDSFIIAGIFIFQLLKGSLQSIFKSPFGLIAIFTALILFVLLGYTVPVLGNLLRYKMPGMLLLCLALVAAEKRY